MKKAIVLIAIVLILGTVAIANAEQIQRAFPFLFMTQQGELFHMDIGDTQTVFIPGGRITVELLEIGYPGDMADVAIERIILSDDNPDPGEEIMITVEMINRGPGRAHDIHFILVYGDESSEEAIIESLGPGEGRGVSRLHTYELEGVYTIQASVFSDMDPDHSNNILCRTVEVGHPEGGTGVCVTSPGPAMPVRAHILYREYRHGELVDEQDLWLNTADIGLAVELVKMTGNKILATVPR